MTRAKLSIRTARIFLLALLCGPVLLSGCSQQHMTNMWKDPSYSDGPMEKVLAVAVRRDPIRRRIWEDAFVEELRAHGVSAAASYTMFPADIPDSLQVIDAVRQESFDGVAISVRLPNVTQETHVAGYSTREPVTVSGPFLRGYTTYWRDVRVPGYTETNQVRRFQTSVWTTRGAGRLIWSGTIEMDDAAAHEPVRNVIRGQLAVELVTAGILPPRRK